jgi:hypothetical protein
MKFRFERTQFGWSCYAKQGNAYQYFGHFLTQREARDVFACRKDSGRAQHEARLLWIQQGGNIG